MPQKELSARRTSEANTGKAVGAAGLSAATSRRRSPRLHSPAECGGAIPAGGVAATPRRRSPRLLSPGEDRGGGAAPTPCRRSARLLSRVGDRGGPASSPGSGKIDEKRNRHFAAPATRSWPLSPKISSVSMGTSRSEKSRRASADVSPETAPATEESPGRHAGKRRGVSSVCEGLRRSLRLSNVVRSDASGGGNSEGDCRRRSARLRASTGKGLMVEVGKRHGLYETGKSMGKQKARKDASRVLTLSGDHGRGCGRNAPRITERAEFGSNDASEESGNNVNGAKGLKKRELSVVSAMEGGRDKKRKQAVERKEEELGARSGTVQIVSCSPGWTSEQEVALHRAYILAKPSPQFWKKVAKMVRGKSAQECFDRMHSKTLTPAPLQPRSRARTVGFSPLGFSDVFKETARRSKSIKKKNLLGHKTVRHILRKHSVMDQGQEADLFSVLETSTNLCADLAHIETPSKTESPELLIRSNGNLSSSHKKMLSRFKSQSQSNYTSPEVLKPVKNIALHEKYIDQLHCREARRRMHAKAACSVSSEDDKENAVPKGDAVKTAKNALISEARGIIFQFGHTQPTPSSDHEDTDGSEDECEEDA